MSILAHSGAGLLLLLAIANASLAQENQVIRPSTGYLFIDGQYIAPPYDVRHDDGSVVINGYRLTELYFDMSEAEQERGGPRGRNRRWQRGPFARNWQRPRDQDSRFDDSRGRDSRGDDFRGHEPFARLANLVSYDVNTLSAIKVLYEGQQPLTIYPAGLGPELLSALSGESDFELDENSRASMEPDQQKVWDRLVSDFEPDDDFLARATGSLIETRTAETEGERATLANWLVAQLSYPLTVFAMVVIVLAFGHLLSNKPSLDPAEDVSAEPSMVRRSLLIIASFSVLDLIWTLSATYAGTMRELNPLGSRIIEDPVLLVAFKFIVTGTSIGILHALQKRPIAQVASWWCCLLLTLLTARWVIFQSMFA